MDKDTRDRQKILSVYILFGISLLLGFVPHMIAAALCLITMVAVLVWAYMVRGECDNPDGLIITHMTHIILTIWVGSALAGATIVLGALYLIFAVDHAPMMGCMNHLLEIASAQEFNPAAMSMQSLSAIFRPCLGDYIYLNFAALIIGALITLAPVLAYFGYRYVRGFRRALRGHIIPDAQRWL